ncbi:MAG TPA: enoyl-CoA hydratase/isomerase family protein [Chitinophagaceae bacterium]|nr:enoyl-CoA hydratase/isomerase family protein [Chitinophagaceae bacterium]
MEDKIKEGYVNSHTEHGITTIEFFHPQSNSLPGKILEKITQEIHYSSNHESKVVILQSAGDGAFCAGASFDELAAVKNETEGFHFFQGFANLINGMRKCNKLIIGRIHGKCVGGGVGIVAACDYALAVKTAEIKLSELSIGIGPFVVGPAVERKIGVSAFSQLAIDATFWRNSEWAKKKGLYAEVHETVQNLDESVYRLANTLAHSSPDAMAEMKKIFWRGTENWDVLLNERAAISGKLVLSDFTVKAIAKFKKKAK